MYDPARDIFTSSEDAAAESNEPGARRKSNTEESKGVPDDAATDTEASYYPSIEHLFLMRIKTLIKFSGTK
jgi:hypothetical protein